MARSLPHLLCFFFSEQIRGALNAAKKCEKADPILVTHSSGNHALAVATAARLCGFGAHVVVARTTPEVKQQAIRSMGAQITNCPSKSVEVCACEMRDAYVKCVCHIHRTGRQPLRL